MSKIKTNIKIRVTPEQSKKIQEICFENGIYWVTDRKIDRLNEPFLFIDEYVSFMHKDQYVTSMNLKDRNMRDMTITCEKFATQNPSVIRFLNCYLNSDQESRKIKRIKDRMSFLAYVIEYK